jgi:deoxyhypusine monooxygenase
MPLEALQVSPETLASLETTLLNKSGNVPLHKRFRALFTLKALKNDDAVNIISKGTHLNHTCIDILNN